MIDRKYIKFNTSIHTATNKDRLIRDEQGNIKAVIELNLGNDLFHTSRLSNVSINDIRLQTSKMRLSMENLPIAQVPLDMSHQTNSSQPTTCMVDVYPYCLLDDGQFAPTPGDTDALNALPNYKNHFVTYTIRCFYDDNEDPIILDVIKGQANSGEFTFPQDSIWWPLVRDNDVLWKINHRMNLSPQTNHEPFFIENSKLLIRNIGTLSQMLQDAFENAVTYGSTSSNTHVYLDVCTDSYLLQPTQSARLVNRNSYIIVPGIGTVFYLELNKNTTLSTQSLDLEYACKPGIKLGGQTLSIAYDTASFDKCIPILWNTPFVNTHDTPEQFTLDDLRNEAWDGVPPPKRVYKYGVDVNDDPHTYNFTLEQPLTCAPMNIICNKAMRDTFSFLPWIEVDTRRNDIFYSPANNRKYNVSSNGRWTFTESTDFSERLQYYFSRITSTYPICSTTSNKAAIANPVVYAYGYYAVPTSSNVFTLADFPGKQFYRQTFSFDDVTNTDHALYHSHLTTVTLPGSSSTLTKKILPENEQYVLFDGDTTTITSDIQGFYVYGSNNFPARYDEIFTQYGCEYNSHPSTSSATMSARNLSPNSSLPNQLHSATPKTILTISSNSFVNATYFWNEKTKRYDIPPLLITPGTSSSTLRQICPIKPDVVKFYRGTNSASIYYYYDIARFADAPNGSIRGRVYVNGTSEREIAGYIIDSMMNITGQTFRFWNKLSTISVITENQNYVSRLRSLVLPNFELDNDGKFYILDGTTADVNIGNQEVICKQPSLYKIDDSIEVTQRVTYENDGSAIILGYFISQNTVFNDGTDTSQDGVPSIGWTGQTQVDRITGGTFSGYKLNSADGYIVPTSSSSTADYIVFRYPYNGTITYDNSGGWTGSITGGTRSTQMGEICICNSYAASSIHSTESGDPLESIPISTKLSNDVSLVAGNIVGDDTINTKRSISRLTSLPDTIALSYAFCSFWYGNSIYFCNVRTIRDGAVVEVPMVAKSLTRNSAYSKNSWRPLTVSMEYESYETQTIDGVEYYDTYYRLADNPFSNGIYTGTMYYTTAAKTIDTQHTLNVTTLQTPEYVGNQRLTFTWDNLPTVVMSPLQSIILTLEGVDVSREIMPINISNANSGASLNNSLPVIESYSSLAQTLRDLHDELVISRDQFDNTATSSINVTGDGLNERSLVFTAQFVTKDGFAYPVYIPPNGVFTLQLTFGVEFGLL